MSSLEFRLLGPLDVRAGGRPVRLGPPKQRRLLAVLAAAPGQAVSIEQLADELWCGRPPASATANLRGYAAGLRRALPTEERARIVSRRTGYSLDLPRDRCDLTVFERLAGEGRAALRDGDPTTAAARLDLAMAMWRGDALEGLTDGPRLSALAERLEEQRASTQEDLFEARLLTAPDPALVGALREWTARFPLRERGWQLLMVALGRRGDPVGALAAYRRARDVLATELGIDPGRELQDLQQAILHRRESVEPAPSVALSGVASPAVTAPPRQLPVVAGRLVGRQALLTQLHKALTTGGGVPGRPAIALVSGPVGVGKSALAVRAAHDLADHYPDGQLYVDLRAADGGQLPPDHALGRMLRALGVAQPAGLDHAELASMFRTASAQRRLLVVLDNAAGPDQVVPLLPASSSCGVLVTSILRLAEMPGELHVAAGPLTLDQGLDLLAQLAGRHRVEADLPAAKQVVQACDGLPLVLARAGARLAGRPDLAIRSLAARLASGGAALGELDGDGGVRARFAVPLRLLRAGRHQADALALRAFHTVGRSALSVFGVADIAAALHVHPAACVAPLDRLVDLHLVEAAGPGRYRCRGAVVAFAGEAARLGAYPGGFPTGLAGRSWGPHQQSQRAISQAVQ